MTTQREISHDRPLPQCRDGHPARHILDVRRPAAGGGHLIECRCCASSRHETFEAALQDWHRRNGRRGPRQPVSIAPADNVVQLDLLRANGGPGR